MSENAQFFPYPVEARFVPCSSVHFFTSGAGSKAWRSNSPDVAPGLKYYWPGQGFGAVEIFYDAFKAVFYGVHGEELYSVVLNKPPGRDL